MFPLKNLARKGLKYTALGIGLPPIIVCGASVIRSIAGTMASGYA